MRVILSPFWSSYIKNDKKSTFSYIDLVYIIGKVKVCALRMCNCFGAWGSFWSNFEARTSKDDMIYIIGKLKAYASRICNNFQAERSFEGHLDIMTSMTKTFSYPGMIKDVKKTQLFLGSLYMSYINSFMVFQPFIA